MPVKFDQSLSVVTAKLLTMAQLAEDMVHTVILALTERNPALLAKVYDDEKKMDQLQREVDDDTVEMIGVYTPVAADLRMLLMVGRINGELERIGDQAVNICHNVEALLSEELLKPLVDIPRMATIAEDMLRRAVNAFTSRSVEEAAAVMRQDNEVDRTNDLLFKELLGLMDLNPRNIHRALGLILTARAIERVADHAVNICEDTIYMVTGKDVRHRHADLLQNHPKPV
jgi:phosphate transport system protein